MCARVVFQDPADIRFDNSVVFRLDGDGEFSLLDVYDQIREHEEAELIYWNPANIRVLAIREDFECPELSWKNVLSDEDYNNLEWSDEGYAAVAWMFLFRPMEEIVRRKKDGTVEVKQTHVPVDIVEPILKGYNFESLILDTFQNDINYGQDYTLCLWPTADVPNDTEKYWLDVLGRLDKETFDSLHKEVKNTCGGNIVTRFLEKNN